MRVVLILGSIPGNIIRAAGAIIRPIIRTSNPSGRLEVAVPETKSLLDLAFAAGESAGTQIAPLPRLLDEYGPAALRRAILEAIAHGTPRAASVGLSAAPAAPYTTCRSGPERPSRGAIH